MSAAKKRPWRPRIPRAPLFTLTAVERKRGDGRKGGNLGFEWIEVLAIEHDMILKPDDEYGDRCEHLIRAMYVCRTPRGITQITSYDLWDAIHGGFYADQLGGP
jgi:hypothetical protein